VALGKEDTARAATAQGRPVRGTTAKATVSKVAMASKAEAEVSASSRAMGQAPWVGVMAKRAVMANKAEAGASKEGTAARARWVARDSNKKDSGAKAG